MRKTFYLNDLDCANCAAKMQEAIEKIAGVEQAEVNFIRQKMTITAADEDFDELMKQVVKVCRKIEPDCEIVL